MTKQQEERYVPLVKMLAEQIKRKLKINMPLEDTVAAGKEGLRIALSQFSTRHGTTFRMFAQYQIRSAIYKEVSSKAEVDIRLLMNVNELMRFRSESAESAGKRSVNGEATELKKIIQCLAAVWLLEHRGELSPHSAKALQAALAELEEHEREILDAPVLQLRKCWKIMEKIRLSLTRKYAA